MQLRPFLVQLEHVGLSREQRILRLRQKSQDNMALALVGEAGVIVVSRASHWTNDRY